MADHAARAGYVRIPDPQPSRLFHLDEIQQFSSLPWFTSPSGQGFFPQIL